MIPVGGEGKRGENVCEFCGAEIQPDSLWMSNEAIYCSSICRKAGQELAAERGEHLERNGVQGWGEEQMARMARLKAAADADMELERAEPTLWGVA